MKKLFTLAVGLFAIAQSFAQVQREDKIDLIAGEFASNAAPTSVANTFKTSFATGENRYVLFFYMGEFNSSVGYPTSISIGGVQANSLSNSFPDVPTKASVAVFTMSEAQLQAANVTANTFATVDIAWSARPSGSYYLVAVPFRYVSQVTGILNSLLSNKGNNISTLSSDPTPIATGDLLFHFSMFTRDRITEISGLVDSPGTKPVSTNKFMGAPIVNMMVPPGAKQQFLATNWSAQAPVNTASYVPTFVRTTTENPTYWIVSASRVPFQNVHQKVSGKVWFDNDGNKEQNGVEAPATGFWVAATYKNGPNAGNLAAKTQVDVNGNYLLDLIANQVEQPVGSGTYVNPEFEINITASAPVANVGQPYAPNSGTGDLGAPSLADANPYYVTNPGPIDVATKAGPFSPIGIALSTIKPGAPFTDIINYNAGIQSAPNTTPGNISVNLFGAQVKKLLDMGGSDLAGVDGEEGNLGDGRVFWIESDPQINGGTAEVKLAYDYNGDGSIDPDTETINASPDETDNTRVRITNFRMNRLYLRYIGGVATNVSGTFFYSAEDAATMRDPSPAPYNMIVILPVNGLELAGTYNNGKANLRWTLTGTDDVVRYELERGNTATSFSRVATLGANGREYNHVDDLAGFSNGDAFYRVKMIRSNGNVSYSNVSGLKLATITGLQLMPTVVQSNLQVRFKNSRSQDVTIRVMNINGQAVMTQTSKLGAGNATISLNGFERLTNGTYSVQVFAGSTVTQGKIVVQH